MFYLPPEEDEI